MTLKLYTLTFKNAHFGEGNLNESHFTFDASRLFSALFLEALKLKREAEFLNMCQAQSFVLSDAFPYIEGQVYLPKPIGYPTYQEKPLANLKVARAEAKKVKKLSYIPVDQMPAYLAHSADIEQLGKNLKKLGTQSAVTRKGEDPYEVGVTAFAESLAIIATQSELFDTLMASLQYSGLGGKRTSGYGQFQLAIRDLPEKWRKNITVTPAKTAMLLTTSVPNAEEMTPSMNGAKYLLKKASGFAYSESTQELLRKQDLYKFKAGSTFETPYRGDIVDVRPDGFPHPVWNYAKALFYELELKEEAEQVG